VVPLDTPQAHEPSSGVKQELLRWDGVLDAELTAIERKLANAWRYTLDPSDVHALQRRHEELTKSKKQHENKQKKEQETDGNTEQRPNSGRSGSGTRPSYFRRNKR
jgi:hypothetical protein